MTWDQVLGPVTGAAVVALLVLLLVGSVRRERRGGGPTLTTVADSRPLWGTTVVSVTVVAGVLVIVRLGALS